MAFRLANPPDAGPYWTRTERVTVTVPPDKPVRFAAEFAGNIPRAVAVGH